MAGRRQREAQRLKVSRCGATVGGKVVYRGCFKLVNERGIALEQLLEELQLRNAVLDWEGFVTDALKAGWTLRGISTRINDALLDSPDRQQILALIPLLLARCAEKHVA